jgi:cytochrome b
VWDPVVRIVHWTLVAGVAAAWIIIEGRAHDLAGYLVLALVLFRILWGFVGPERARFKNFVRSPDAVLRYLKALLAGNEPRHIGHNPLGGWMILALLATALATAVSGWLYTTDAFWGVAWVETVHVVCAKSILVLATLHVLGVLFTSIRHRENLIAAMFHGRKKLR